MSSSTSSLSSSPSSTVVTSKSDPNHSSDSDMNLDVDVNVGVDVADIEKGQKISVAAAQQAKQQQQQQHSVTNEEVISQGLTTTEEDEKASCRSRMMMMVQQQENSSSFCIRISDLSSTVQNSIKVLELDVDGDGQLDTDEILWAMNQLTTQTKIHSNLKQMIVGLCTFLMLLIICIVASSIAAVRLVNDTEIDPVSGIMYVKKGRGGTAHRSSTIMKTEAVEIYSNATILAKMSNAELDILKAILPGNNGNVKFQVKGYARNNGTNNEEIMVLVEGGTITYDRKGIQDATGNAKVLLTFAYGDVFDYSNHYRYNCNDGYVSSGGPGQQPHL